MNHKQNIAVYKIVRFYAYINIIPEKHQNTLVDHFLFRLHFTAHCWINVFVERAAAARNVLTYNIS